MASNIKRIEFNDILYRANESANYKPNTSAVINYAGAPMKYFTLNKNETKAYTTHGKLYVKSWMPTSPLNLIDILHLPTRRALAQIIGDESLNIAFPIINNKVSRISEMNTREHDDNVLQAICENRLADGYYMRAIENNNRYVFHSEVGICPSAFHKLKLSNVNKNRSIAPSLNRSRRNKSRFRNSGTKRSHSGTHMFNSGNKNKYSRFLNLLQTTRKKPHGLFYNVNNSTGIRRTNNNTNKNRSNAGPISMQNLNGNGNGKVNVHRQLFI